MSPENLDKLPQEDIQPAGTSPPREFRYSPRQALRKIFSATVGRNPELVLGLGLMATGVVLGVLERPYGASMQLGLQ